MYFNTHRLFVLLIVLLLLACTPNKPKSQSSTVNIRQSEDASGLNPITIRDGFSNYLSMQLFQTLIGIDFKSNEIVGIIAKDKGTVTVINDSALKISFEIREEAKFDDGRPITAEDVQFSTKLHLLKGINSFTSRFFEFVDNVIVDSTNFRKLHFIVSNSQMQADFYCGSIYLMDHKVYDPKAILKTYSIPEIKSDSIYEKTEIKEIISSLNDQKFAKNKNFIKGSGSYEIEEWNEGRNIRLNKKENWWGDALKQTNSFFNANAPKLNYEIINDENTAVVSLKNGRIDLMSELSPRQFNQLKMDENFKSKFKLATAQKMGYHCLGFNLNHPVLNDIHIRKAIAHCLNKELFIEKVLYGLAEPTNGPLAPWREKIYNNEISAIPFDLNKAKEELNKSKWFNQSPIEIEYAYNAGNKEREALGLILKEEAAKIGININLAAYEWSVYLQKLKSGELELFYSAVSSSLLPPNYNSSFHSSAANGGRNYFNYKNETADSLIHVMNRSNQLSDYAKASKSFQELLNNDLPCIFLYSEKETFVFSKSIQDFYPSSARPHYWAPVLSKK
ncbi:MAG: hypothetical protein CMC96_05335 [Flavobacteriales bacterium]|nr:hypothetical protein [Flavobacteriales bacterium]|tara:strand:- start:16528 stop:18213 length:1686 start_codon:yes stop_codon:yes gene_type:complete